MVRRLEGLLLALISICIVLEFTAKHEVPEFQIERATTRRTLLKYHTCHTNATHQVRLRQKPDLIILGAQKAGTTAVYKFLSQHPDVAVPVQFEPHFFDLCVTPPTTAMLTAEPSPHMIVYSHYGRSRYRYRNRTEEEIRCQIFVDYCERLKIPDNTTVSVEKTPSYMFYSDLPRAISDTVPWAKWLVLLRNPVDRLYSQYQMVYHRGYSTTGTNLTLEAVLDEELDLLVDYNLIDANLTLSQNLTRAARDELDAVGYLGSDHQYRRYLQRGMYFFQLERWLQYSRLNETLLVLPFEELKLDPKRTMRKVTDFLGISPLHLPDAAWHKTFIPRAGFNSKTSQRKADPMSPKVRAFLMRFYEPYNELLADLLGPEWKNYWW